MRKKKCTPSLFFVSKVWPSHQIRPSSQCKCQPLKCKNPKLDFVLVQNFPISTPCYGTERLTLTMVPFCALLLMFCVLAWAGDDLNHFYEVPYDKERPKEAIQPKYNVLFISEDQQERLINSCKIGIYATWRPQSEHWIMVCMSWQAETSHEQLQNYSSSF